MSAVKEMEIKTSVRNITHQAIITKSKAALTEDKIGSAGGMREASRDTAGEETEGRLLWEQSAGLREVSVESHVTL